MKLWLFLAFFSFAGCGDDAKKSEDAAPESTDQAAEDLDNTDEPKEPTKSVVVASDDSGDEPKDNWYLKEEGDTATCWTGYRNPTLSELMVMSYEYEKELKDKVIWFAPSYFKSGNQLDGKYSGVFNTADRQASQLSESDEPQLNAEVSLVCISDERFLPWYLSDETSASPSGCGEGYSIPNREKFFEIYEEKPAYRDVISENTSYRFFWVADGKVDLNQIVPYTGPQPAHELCVRNP
jgi:hypothetical protein